MFPLIQMAWSILFILFLQPHFSSAGEVYRWMDEKGTIHFTDDLSKIPKSYLDQTEKREVPKETIIKEEALRKSAGEESSDQVKEYLKNIEKKIEAKKKLEKKIDELEEEMRLSGGRLKEIEEYEKRDFQYQTVFNRRSGRWVPVASPYHEEKRRLTNRIESIKKELHLLQENLSEINRSL